VIFVVQNTEKTEVKFLFFDVQIGVWFGLAVSLVLGLLIGWLIGRRNRD